MKVLILGGTGMLGHKLVQRFEEPFETWTSIQASFSEVERFGIFERDRTIEDVRATDLTSLRSSIETIRPDVVVNAIGVIKRLPTSHNVSKMLLINSIFPHRLAALSSEFRFRLIQISTDCVFDGKRGNYNEEDDTNATDLYGRSKSLGEISDGNCLTLRTSIIGRELATHHSLIEWFLSNSGGKVNGFVNAIYSGFPTIVFADIISNLILEHKDLKGIFHVSSDPIDKFQLLNLVNEHFRAGITIDRADDFTIDRSLDSTKFRNVTGFRPRPWEEMIASMAADAMPYEKWRQ